MERAWTIDDVARTSDDAVVRMRFARRNRVWLIILLVFFGLASFIQLVEKRKMAGDRWIAAISLLVAVVGIVVARHAAERQPQPDTFLWRLGARVRTHINAVTLGGIAIEYALALIWSRNADDWFGWAISLPFMVLGLRMLVAELVLLHVYLLGGGVLMMFIGRIPRNVTGLAISLVVINILTLGFQLWSSRRLRREVISEFTSRRVQAREQIRMRDELRYARELQLSMLPECAPALEWADICSVSLPATEVGGDYYDYFVDGDRVALVCGDVAGHGMASGLVLSGLRSGFTLLRDNLADPAAVLQRLHDMVVQTTRRRMLVTVSVVLLDRARGRATIASAGHPPVILRRAVGPEGPTVETIDLFAPPLGVRLPVVIPQRQLAVAPGDVVVLHSDGIYETQNAAGESYGFDRLQQVIRDRGDGPAEELRDAILADLAGFRGALEQDDDVTLVVCRLT